MIKSSIKLFIDEYARVVPNCSQKVQLFYNAPAFIIERDHGDKGTMTINVICAGSDVDYIDPKQIYNDTK